MNIYEFEMSPQEALDSPRFCILAGDATGAVALEDGIPVNVIQKLQKMGHNITILKGRDRACFGRGQVIENQNSHNQRVWAAGSGICLIVVIYTKFIF